MFKQFHSRHPALAWAGEDAHPFFMSERHGHKRPGHRGAPGGGWGDEPRTRRGDIKFMLLGLLCERPQHAIRFG